ncbi:hypothetical protein GGI19_002255 [Coemansia pectinata]|uniref:Uncharacterized protein n=1 Tax=Coemansia pectinata TaxID=1052879 RepID=A0A9W8H0F7_9FUNG|nr:hypothetical protein GGI19_002255 [Coemansia pectinata]
MSNGGARAYSDGAEDERTPLVFQPYCPPPAPLSPEDIRQRRRSLGLESQLTADARSYDGTWPNSTAASALPSPLPPSPGVSQGVVYHSSYGAVSDATGRQSSAVSVCRPSGCCVAACGSDSAVD